MLLLLDREHLQLASESGRVILIDIYSHLCLTDESFRAALIATGPRPFRLQCAQPWGNVPNQPDTSVLHHTAARADLISDILIEVRVCAASNTLTPSRWKHSRPGTRRAVISVAERAQAQSEVLAHTAGAPFVSQPLYILDLRNASDCSPLIDACFCHTVSSNYSRLGLH